jgi:NADPH-dependent 2,4-dienoyl-CoA reductase/sulfur reductase-like enzyme
VDSEIRSVVVIGAGQAGGRAVLAMREAGYAGKITLVGDEPHPPYERPILSKAFLLEPNAPAAWVLDADGAAAAGVELRLGLRAIAIDRDLSRVRLSDGAVLDYDRLLIATGSAVRRLTVPGLPAEDVVYLRTIDDARQLERRLRAQPDLVVIGGGFIGLEVAVSAAKRGARVTVLEAADRLLPRLGSPEVSDLVARHHRANGVDVRLGVRALEARDGTLVLSDGGQVPVDFVVAGIGVSPDTALAAEAGLEVDDGILVDAYGGTSDPRIFAAGDVTRHFSPPLGRLVRLESWQNANLQAKAAALSLLGSPTPHDETAWVWSDQGDLNIQIAGCPAQIDQTVVRGTDLETGWTVFQLHGGRLVGGLTVNRAKDMPLIRRGLANGGLRVDPTELADEAAPLRRIFSTKEPA